ncbi:hypothetical protein GCM10027160_28870 [Streptomyces calidiresistens]|uniref:Uncharacterized protein n=1 Tax=Streptomyces calidiresistens TaxID=1485586 RepID=A0A7W3T2S6_9ACTN|nr:hypothetical protein [Streptomyces calidiresistens]MBB0229889.1 hypothetical protein [Streptomyces calidiresistens]
MDLYLSYLRTAVPVLVGMASGFLTWLRLDIDSEQLLVLVTGIAGLAWYTIWRGLEWVGQRQGWSSVRRLAGWLLGMPAAPSYPVTTLAAVLAAHHATDTPAVIRVDGRTDEELIALIRAAAARDADRASAPREGGP